MFSTERQMLLMASLGTATVVNLTDKIRSMWPTLIKKVSIFFLHRRVIEIKQYCTVWFTECTRITQNYEEPWINTRKQFSLLLAGSIDYMTSAVVLWNVGGFHQRPVVGWGGQRLTCPSAS